MANTLNQLLQEAERRGVLGPEVKALVQEGTSRGLVDPLNKNAFGEAVVTTPLPRPTARSIQVPLEGAGSVPMSVPENPPEHVLFAADAGVLFDQPAEGGHFLSSLAFDRRNEVEAYRQALNKDENQQIDVRMGPASGQIEYFVPDKSRFSLVKPPRAHIAELQSLGGTGITMGTEVLAGGLTALATKSPALTALGAGGGATIGELMRLELGRRMGINQDVPAEDIIEQAAKTGAVAAGAGIAGEKLFRLSKFMYNMMRGRIVSDDLVGAGVDMEDAIKIQKAINERLDDQQFRFNVAQASNDEDLLNYQEVFKRSKEYSKQFGEFSDKQSTALNAYWTNINRPYRTRKTPTEVTEDVRGVAGSDVEREIAPADIFAESKQAELRHNLSSLSERPPEQLGSLLRDVGDREQQAFRNWADQRAKELNAAVGDAEFIVNSNTHTVVNDINDETRRLLFDSLKRSRTGLIGEAPQQVVEEGAEELAEEAVDEAADEVASSAAKVWDPDAKFTFQEAWSTVSALKTMERQSARGLSTESPDTGTIKRLIGALESDIDESFGKSSAGDLYDAFKHSYQVQKSRLDEGTVAKLMERRGGANGRFVMSDEQAFERLMVPGDKRAAQEISELIRDDPDALDAMRSGFASLYRNKVVKDGRIDIGEHEDFMRRRGSQLGVFFNREELKLIRDRRGVEAALRAREKRRDVVLERVNKSFEGQVTNLKDVDALSRLALDRANPEKSAELVSMLKRTPDVLRGVQSIVRQKMHEGVVGPMRNGKRAFSATRFNDYLNGKSGELGHRTNLKNIFGDEYVSNLDALNQALTITGREARFPNRSNTAFWSDTLKNLTRAYVGLFTRPGRFLTALDRLRGRAANKVIVKAMLNPDDLEKMISLKGVDLRSAQARTILGALGGTALTAGPRPGDFNFDSAAF